MSYIDELISRYGKERGNLMLPLKDACSEVDSLRARLAVAEKGLHAIADSCENCTNGGDLRAVAENVLRGLPLGNLKKTGCDDRYCIQTDREKKKLEERLAVADAALAAAVSKAQLNLAVNRSCSCGGRPPGTPSTCPACEVWHRLFGDLAPPKPVPIDAALHPATKEGKAE